MRLVAVIGTDGSGKTTLTDAVVTMLRQQGVAADRVWMGAESIILKPIRALLRLWWARSKNVEGRSNKDSYSNEVESKQRVVRVLRWAVPVYVAIVMIDYHAQVWVKRHRFRQNDVAIADRYLFDVAVNLGLTLGWTPDEVVRFVNRRLSSFKLPDARFFLRVPVEVSMARKDDIPDAEYVRRRLAYYDAIAQAYGFTVVDGLEPPDRSAQAVVEEVLRALDETYVIYVHSNNLDVGGADLVLASMAEHIDRRAGYRAAVVLRAETAILDRYRSLGVPVFLGRFVRPQLSRGMRGVFAAVAGGPAAVAYFVRLYRRERPDLVHVNDLYDFLPAIAARLLRIPTVYHIRAIREQQLLRVGLSGLIRVLSDTVVCVSDAVRKCYFGPRWSRARVVHDLANAALVERQGDISCTISRPAELPARGRLALMIGRIEPWKGQLEVLDAIGRIPDAIRNAHVFALVGGPVEGKEDYFELVERRAKALGVVLLGQRNDIAQLLRAAEISIHFSIEPDPFPGVVLESLLSGCATIAADSGGVPEIIAGRESGILIRPGDVNLLTSTLTNLLTSAQSPREKYAETGRRCAMSLVEPGRIDGQIAQIYDQLVGAGMRKRGVAI